MIHEESIIPYTKNWKTIKSPQIQQINIKDQFTSSLILHLDMIRRDGGNVIEELDKLINKYSKNPNIKINRDEILSIFMCPIFE